MKREAETGGRRSQAKEPQERTGTGRGKGASLRVLGGGAGTFGHLDIGCVAS